MNSAPYSGAAIRRSALHFLGGKAASGALTFVLVLWTVRLLPVADYGVYVTLIAGIELGIPIAAIGLFWKAARYIPEFRMHAGGARLRNFAWCLLRLQTLSLVVCALCGFLMLDLLLAALNLQVHRTAALCFLLLLVTEGMGRFVRECLLGPLLQQAAAQTSLVSRALMQLMLVASLVATEQMSLMAFVVAELAASTVALLVALLGLTRILRSIAGLQRDPDWVEPSAGSMWRMAMQMYSAHLMTLLYSPQAFTLLLQRSLGTEAVAVFGFLRMLHDQLARYLPAALLFSVIRPKLVASYVGGGGVSELAANANLVGKLSLFTLMPFVVLAAVGGQPIVAALSGGKFADSGGLLLGFMLAMLPFSQRQLLETVAVASGNSAWCMPAAASGVLMLPLMLVLLGLGLGLWAPVAALCLGHLLFNGILLFGVHRAAGYRADAVGAFKLLLAAAVSCLIATVLPLLSPGLGSFMVLACAALLGFVTVAWWLKPFTPQERARINRPFRRQLFVW